jgi:hypothetical protein
MKYTIFLVIFGCLLIGGLLILGVELYVKELLFLAIGALLIVTSTLLFLELKKIRNDPLS